VVLAHETDFLELYERLGLSQGCDLLELKQAYRRHVSALHPDRPGTSPPDALAAERLQRLIAQYGAAMEFQRLHGRLPGTAARARFAMPAESPAAPRPRLAPVTGLPRSRPVMLILLAVAVMGMLWWNLDPPPSPSPTMDGHADPAASQAADRAPAVGPALALGMSPESVREVEGEPLIIHGDRWEYGPSWIRFEDDRVVEWHSSPLHALKAVRDPQPVTP
jgi:hypothetical protein